MFGGDYTVEDNIEDCYVVMTFSSESFANIIGASISDGFNPDLEINKTSYAEFMCAYNSQKGTYSNCFPVGMYCFSGYYVPQSTLNSLKYLSHTTTVGEYDPDTGIWSFDELDVGSEVVLTISTRVLSSGKIVNSAGVLCAEDSNDTNNNDSAFVTTLKNNGEDENSTINVTKVDIFNKGTSGSVSDSEDVSLKSHATGNPILLVLLSLFTIFIGYRKKSN